jgi:hypothetical protein
LLFAIPATPATSAAATAAIVVPAPIDAQSRFVPATAVVAAAAVVLAPHVRSRRSSARWRGRELACARACAASAAGAGARSPPPASRYRVLANGVGLNDAEKAGDETDAEV